MTETPIFGPFVLLIHLLLIYRSLLLRRGSFDDLTFSYATSLDFLLRLAFVLFSVGFLSCFFVGTGRSYSSVGDGCARWSCYCPKWLGWYRLYLAVLLQLVLHQAAFID